VYLTLLCIFFRVNCTIEAAMKANPIALLLSFLTCPALAQPLPDGEVARFGDWKAWLTGPTTRYAHGALGDEIEASGFVVAHKGKDLRFELDDLHVFEDRRVRLVQLDGDAAPEAVIIRSHVSEGASIAVYNIGDEEISLKAESPNIGMTNRWLNIVGFGDFTGRGKVEIAVVVTPHLAGSLRVYEMKGTRLLELARIDGYTNHINGTRELDLAEVADRNGDGVIDITLPRIRRGGKAVVTFAGGKARELPF
jgi:hypothetical protein